MKTTWQNYTGICALWSAAKQRPRTQIQHERSRLAVVPRDDLIAKKKYPIDLRCALVAQPDMDETPLSDDEVWFGVVSGIIKTSENFLRA